MRYSITAAAAAVTALSYAATPALAASDDPCKQFAQSITTSYTGLDADLFRECIQRVPFDQEKAGKTVKNLRRFMLMNSHSDYFIDPPTAELELQPFNLNRTWNQIESKIHKKQYKNNWAFERDLVQMFQNFRDGHVDFETQCTHGYLYTHNFPVYQLADKDGEEPSLYHIEFDAMARTYTPPKIGSKIKKINGRPATDYLEDWARTTPEQLQYQDPDARFNSMMFSWPEGASSGIFAMRNMWAGEDIRITWENGTDTIVEFSVAMKAGITKGGVLLFNDTQTMTDFCLPDTPPSLAEINASKKEKRALSKSSKTPLPNGYPEPMATLEDIDHSLMIYRLSDDQQTAVIVIRTFSQASSGDPGVWVRNFSKFFSTQLKKLKLLGVKRLIFDMSGNGGGFAILPYDLIKQLFPSREDFSNVNMKYSPLTWAYMRSLGRDEDDSWTRVDGTDFKDMKDWLGPVLQDGNYYTKLWKQDYKQFGDEIYSLDINYSHEPYFDAENIVVVSDTLCASACHSFIEGLSSLGVRAYAYGGRPDNSAPMQMVGGTKGGKVVDYDYIQPELVRMVNNGYEKELSEIGGPKKDWILEELPLAYRSIRLNSENKFRKGEALPLQFVYSAACDKFFITKEMFGDPTKMWGKVKELAWNEKGEKKECRKYQSVRTSADKFETGDEEDEEEESEDAAWDKLNGDEDADELFRGGKLREWKDQGQIVWTAMRHHG